MQFPHNSLFFGMYVHHFPGQRNTFKRQGLAWGFRTAICTGEAFRIKCDLSACAVNLLIFLFGCAAYGLLFKRTRAMRSNSVFKAIAMLAKPAKICQRSARTSGEICTLIVEGDQSVQIGCSTLSTMPFIERCTRQKNICNFMDFCLYVSGYYLLNSYVFSKSASFAKM